MLGPCAKPFHHHPPTPPPQILEVLLLVDSCHRNPNLYLFCLSNKLALVVFFMGCSVPLLPLTLHPQKRDPKEQNVWQLAFNPPPPKERSKRAECLATLLSSSLPFSTELFKSKIQNLAEAATMMQKCASGLCVLWIQQIGERAVPREQQVGQHSLKAKHCNERDT